MERLSPAAGRDSVAPAYERHRPEDTVLYGVVQSELESLLARVRDRPLHRVAFDFRGSLATQPRRVPRAACETRWTGYDTVAEINVVST